MIVYQFVFGVSQNVLIVKETTNHDRLFLGGHILIWDKNIGRTQVC